MYRRELNYVDYEKYVPLDYYEKGKVFPASWVQSRVDQLLTWQQLYHGDYSGFLGGDTPVWTAWEMIFSNSLADIALSTPPEFAVTGWEMPPRFAQQLLRVLRNHIIDWTRYGTALFYIGQDDYSVTVTAPQPIFYFPASADEEMLAIVQEQNSEEAGVENTIELHKLMADGAYRIEYREYPADTLGDIVDVDGGVIGDSAQWLEIMNHSDGRPNRIVKTLRPEITGDWGASLYAATARLSIGLNQLQASDSRTLERHGNPKLLFINEDASMWEDFAQNNIEAKVEQAEKKKDWDKFLNEDVQELPGGVRPEYLMYPGDLHDHREHFKQLKDQMFAVTALHATMYGLDAGADIPASGKAYEELRKRMTAYVKAMQTDMITSLQRAIMIAAIVDGNTVPEVEVDWSNPFDSDVVKEGEEVEVQDEDEPNDGETPDELLPSE